jgi:RNA polymerase sigma-70 factor, ECF subfamily
MKARWNTLRGSQQAGSESAEYLYDKYAPVLLSLCLRYVGNIQDAEDVLHDGFIKIFRNLHKFRKRDTGSIEGWMRRIIVNTALNFIRDNSRERYFSGIDSMHEAAAEEPEDPTVMDHLLESFNKETLMEMVIRMPVGYRTVFNLYVFESYSHKEIASALNCSENTSKSQLSKARAYLRKQLTGSMTENKEKKQYGKG